MSLDAHGVSRRLPNWLSFFASRNQGNHEMIFKVTFVDGSVETVNAGTPGEARFFATRQFRDRIVVRVERAGLTDMMSRRSRAAQEPPSRKN